MTKIGILGGTFDPIHYGHLITAQMVLEIRELDKIIFVPSYISPHKINYDYALPQHRYKMTELAIKSNPYFDISDFEIKRDEISYTYNTILEFSKIYKKIELIIGFDNLITFHTWHKPDKIIKIAKLIVMKRTYDKDIKEPNNYFGEAIFVNTPTVEISASIIRDRILKRKSIDYLLPDQVIQYIKKNNLYGAQ